MAGVSDREYFAVIESLHRQNDAFSEGIARRNAIREAAQIELHMQLAAARGHRLTSIRFIGEDERERRLASLFTLGVFPEDADRPKPPIVFPTYELN